MTELERSVAQQRHAWRAGVLNRLTRWRNQLLKRWWIPCATILLALAGAALLWRFDQPLYTSYGRMIVNLKLTIPEGSLYTEELNNFLGTQAALMQSGAVLQRAHTRAGQGSTALDPGPVGLKVLIQPKTTIFVLQATGADPQYTRVFVQACMEEYVSLKKEMREQTSDVTLAGLTDELTRLGTELHKCDEDLVAFQSSNSVVLLQEQGNSAGSFLAALSQRLAGLKSEYSLLQLLKPDQLLERPRHTDAGTALTASVATFDASELGEPDYFRARQQLALLKAEQQDLGQFLRPKHPKMLGLTEEIARRERLLEIFREETAQQLQSRREALKLEIANLEDQVCEWDARALEVSRKSAEFQRLKANSQRTQALYDRLLAAMQSLDVNKQISPESVSIMEKASQPVPTRKSLSQKLLLAGGAGLLAGALILLLLDRLDDRFGSLSEMQELFPEQVVGQIPRERSALGKMQPGLLQSQDERYAFVEAYRNLRSSLLYMDDPDQRPRTILVTSSVPNDGKSLTSANLAITLASAGAKVLLVDADLRKGSLHHRFGLKAGTPGLSEALDQNCAKVDNGEPIQSAGSQEAARWRSLVQVTKVENLFLLPRGNTTPRSSELFLSAATVRFLQQSAVAYDAVILDTAPVMAADDVTSLAPHVDGVLFVIRAEHTSARVARAALDLLYLRRVKILGLVFNAVRPASADYYNYYQYKDYYASYPTA